MVKAHERLRNPALYRSRRDHLFDITEFRYKESYTNGLEVLGENIHFDISGYFVIFEFVIEGVAVDCICNNGNNDNNDNIRAGLIPDAGGGAEIRIQLTVALYRYTIKCYDCVIIYNITICSSI